MCGKVKRQGVKTTRQDLFLKVQEDKSRIIYKGNNKREIQMKISTKAKCVECGRVFDLLNETDASEWAYGHDCEVA